MRNMKKKQKYSHKALIEFFAKRVGMPLKWVRARAKRNGWYKYTQDYRRKLLARWRMR